MNEDERQKKIQEANEYLEKQKNYDIPAAARLTYIFLAGIICFVVMIRRGIAWHLMVILAVYMLLMITLVVIRIVFFSRRYKVLEKTLSAGDIDGLF